MKIFGLNQITCGLSLGVCTFRRKSLAKISPMTRESLLQPGNSHSLSSFCRGGYELQQGAEEVLLGTLFLLKALRKLPGEREQ